MNPYLEKLRALKLEKGAPVGTDKTDKRYIGGAVNDVHATPDGTFVGFVGVQGSPFSEISPAPYARVLAALESSCPDHIEPADWQQAVANARVFLARWGEQAAALGWTTRDLFGLAPVPDAPHPSFRRLSRYDETGLLWLLHGRPVVALAESTAAIQCPAGTMTTYRRRNKPALGPVGDSLDDLT